MVAKYATTLARKVKLILNGCQVRNHIPMANMSSAWKVAKDLRPMVAKCATTFVAEYGHADWSGTVYPTHAIELARQAGEQGYDMVIAVGGDGTVHEVINGLMQVPARDRPLLGNVVAHLATIVPTGSGNDFAHTVGVFAKPEAALNHALSGEATPIDLGLLTDEDGRKEYFDNTLGLGFDAVVTIRSHKLPNVVAHLATIVRGFLMYLTAVIQTIILNFDPMGLHVETESETWDLPTLMLTLCNGPREGGGFLVAPQARLDDGILHYATMVAKSATTFRKVSRPMMFRLIPEVMKGTHGRFKPVRMGTCRKMSLTSDRPIYIHADGEIYTGFGSNLRQLSIEVVPNALRVVR